MLPPKPEKRRFHLVESGVPELRMVIPRVLRHFDSSSMDSIADQITDSIESQGMRFVAAQAFAVPSRAPARNLDDLTDDAGQELASAYLQEYPGKLASLVGPWIDRGQSLPDGSAAATEVLSLLIERARYWGVELVQAVIDEDSPFPTAPLNNAGLVKLSTLYQMAIDFSAPNDWRAKAPDVTSWENECATPTGNQLRWKRYSPADEAVWIEWMDATYEQTADCPELNGLRTTARTLEGYLASSGAKVARLGVPEWWGAFEGDEHPSGRVEDRDMVSAFMLSDAGGGFWELSYMGVAPAYRGQGLGNETLDRAMSRARALNAQRLTLAVDCRNAYAIRLYRERGFQRIRQLEAWFRAFRS